MKITDEMVEDACREWFGKDWPDGFGLIHFSAGFVERARSDMRRVLEVALKLAEYPQ